MSHVSFSFKWIKQTSLELEEHTLLDGINFCCPIGNDFGYPMVPSHEDESPAQHRGMHHPGQTKNTQKLENDPGIANMEKHGIVNSLQYS